MKAEAILYTGAGLAVIGAGAYVAYKISQEGASVADAVSQLADKVNPLSPDNLAAAAANKVVQSITGDGQATLGTKIFEWLHPNEPNLTDPVAVKPPVAAAAAPYVGDLPLATDPQIGTNLSWSGAPLPDEINGVPVTPFWYGAP